MPPGAVIAMCALLLGLACAMTSQAIALAADGSFQLVRVLSTGSIYGEDARYFATSAHQGVAVIAVHAGITDTRLLAIALGIGQLVLPAVAWALAIILSRGVRLDCAAVAMVAGLSAGTTWFVNVSEIILAAPLTVLVAVFLWRPQSWRARDAILATIAATILVASYETALLTGSVLTAWAVWRAHAARGGAERIGCWIVGALSALSVGVALWGSHAGRNPTHSQSFLYFVVSLEPWPLYAGLVGIAAVIVGFGPWLAGGVRRVVLTSGCIALIVTTFGLEPNVVTGFQARGGAAVAALLLELFLWARWIGRRRTVERRSFDVDRRGGRLIVAVAVLLVAAMVAGNARGVRDWSRSLNAFRAEVDRAQGAVYVTDVLPSDRRAVLFNWTSSSLSLLVRSNPHAGILVDRHPAIVPFAIHEARRPIDDKYRWSR
jgi:hypothetical protein